MMWQTWPMVRAASKNGRGSRSMAPLASATEPMPDASRQALRCSLVNSDRLQEPTSLSTTPQKVTLRSILSTSFT
jgi:hypothetical protein